jgi:hypothetical protein
VYDTAYWRMVEGSDPHATASGVGPNGSTFTSSSSRRVLPARFAGRVAMTVLRRMSMPRSADSLLRSKPRSISTRVATKSGAAAIEASALPGTSGVRVARHAQWFAGTAV